MPPIVVAGAGIAGLAAALALSRAGQQVALVERRSALGEAGAGLQLSPNATRILDRWGLLGAARDVGVELQAIRIRRGESGRELSRVDLASTAARRFGAPFLTLHRADLHKVLLDAVRQESTVSLRLGTAVETAVSEATGVAVHVSERGETGTIHGRAVVDAGGFRKALPDRESALPRSRWTAWRALADATACADWLREPCSNLWLGTRAHLVHYPVRRGALVNVVAIVERQAADAIDEPDVWSVPGELSALLPAFQGWSPLVTALLRSAPEWRVWPLVDGSGLRTPWSNGPLTRVGDAAHAMLPFLAQGASQSIEDAAALAHSVLDDPDDLASAFGRYESARRPRAQKVQDASRRQGTVYHFGGAAALARDAVLRVIGSDGMLRRMDWLYAS